MPQTIEYTHQGLFMRVYLMLKILSLPLWSIPKILFDILGFILPSFKKGVAYYLTIRIMTRKN